MRFPTTRRSAVFASASDDPTERRDAFEALVAAYWKPVYKYVRVKWNATPDDAADLTQGFFARAIEKSFFATYDPAKAAFRTFLRTCLDGFVANERKSAERIKRGGGVQILSLDFTGAEGELREHPPAPNANPEEWFHREWMRSLFTLALDDLRAEAARRGKQVAFQMFERYHVDPDQSGSYASLAAEFGLPVTTVTNHLAWGRREFRRLLVERVRDTAGSDDLPL
jgi:DNA-directed RNA polymerase specialized sigma24 family protein